jgi:hypothetical protein
MIRRRLTMIAAWLGVALAITFARAEVSAPVHLALVPLYTMFLFVSVANLTDGVRPLTWLILIPTFVGMLGDVLETATAAHISPWMENFGFAIGASALAAACYLAPKRRWNVVISGISPLPLAIAWAIKPEWFATALAGSLGGFWLTLVIVTVQQARAIAKADQLTKAASVATILLACVVNSHAQELEPRAYGIAPVRTTIGLVQVGGSKGDILFDPAVGVTYAEADLKIVTAGFGYTFDFGGRQARILTVVPAAFGNITANAGGQSQRQELRGLADPRVRFSIGLKGAPARSASEIAEIARSRRRSAMGAAVTFMLPLGQYNPEQVANLGYNRWAFKPEFGISQTINRWTLDGAAGVWLFTINSAYFPGGRRKEQSSVASFQGHLSYALPNRAWIALDGAFFTGGETRVEGTVNPDRQENTRLGTTFSLPIGRLQSIKFAYSTGLRTLHGTDFDNFSVTWQLVKF